MNDEGMLQRYLELRLKRKLGHRAASREAGYAHGSSKSAQRAFKFILEVQAGRKSRVSKPEEVQLWLIARLHQLTEKSREVRDEIADIKLKLKAINEMNELNV